MKRRRGRPKKITRLKEEFSTGAVRDTRKNKGRYDLIPWSVIRGVALRFEQGAEHYGERNWEKGQPLSRYLDSCLRHLVQHVEGLEDERHDIAAIWNLIALSWTHDKIKDGSLPASLDDLGRKSPSPKTRDR